MITNKEIVEMLSLQDETEVKELFERAYQVKLKYVGNKVYFRGIVEVSNVCAKNCYYCGIRRDNSNVVRYDMTDNEIIDASMWAFHNCYGSVVLQSGERSDSQFTQRITRLLNVLKDKSEGKLGITLSLGEQSADVYQEWYDAGAHRYLLRIETSDEELYKKFHPEHHLFKVRKECLNSLKRIGYQTGTGVLIGLPGQTVEHLADDIQFFKDFDVDMIGMGPFILHKDTPLYEKHKDMVCKDNLSLSLKMIAVARIVLKDINIASTTALQALDPIGRELGLKAGANIIMPVITDVKYRSHYQLYEGKPCMDENAEQCRGCLQNRIASIGEEIGFSQWGDSPHYAKRGKEQG